LSGLRLGGKYQKKPMIVLTVKALISPVIKLSPQPVIIPITTMDHATETIPMIPNTERWILSIDKLSLVYTDPVPDRVLAICAEIVHRVKSGQYPGGILKSHRRFEVQVSLPIANSSERFLLQAGAKGKNLRDYRLEFNPVVIGPWGWPISLKF
jgi:hypothetical protein